MESKDPKPTYTIILASMPSEVDPDRRLAQVLKNAKRQHKFRCVSVKLNEPTVRKKRTTQKAIGG